MKKTFVRFASVCAIVISIVSLNASAAQAASLSQTQISAIVSLLQAFGANASIISHVQAVLSGAKTGPVMPVSSSTPPTQVCPAWGCNYHPTPISAPTSTPVISYISPSSAAVGTTVYVYGSGFDTNSTVYITGFAIPVSTTFISSSELSFAVPSDAPYSDINPGNNSLVVGEGAIKGSGPLSPSNSVNLNILSSTQTSTNTATSCSTQGTIMFTANDGTGYIGCDIVSNGTFDLADSYCTGQTSGKTATGLSPDLYGRTNYYYTTLTGLNLQEQVNVFIKSNGNTIQCTPSLNTGVTVQPNPTPVTPPVTTTQPVVTVTSPKLTLNYDSANKEASLVATFAASIQNTSSQTLYVFQNASIQLKNNTDSTKSYYASGSSVPVVSSVKSVTNQYGQTLYAIPAGQTASFTVNASQNPKILFAGNYTAYVSYLSGTYNTSDVTASFTLNVPQTVTNSQVIVGEVSPYITSATSIASSSGEIITVNGVRLQNAVPANWSYGYSNLNRLSDGSQISFISQISNGSYGLQVSDPTTGASNGVTLSVTDAGSVAPASTTSVTSPAPTVILIPVYTNVCSMQMTGTGLFGGVPIFSQVCHQVQTGTRQATSTATTSPVSMNNNNNIATALEGLSKDDLLSVFENLFTR